MQNGYETTHGKKCNCHDYFHGQGIRPTLFEQDEVVESKIAAKNKHDRNAENSHYSLRFETD